MNIISRAVLVDIKSGEYQAKEGKVIRVFDTNGYGALLPVAFKQNGNDSKFTLLNLPVNQVWAETVVDQGLEGGEPARQLGDSDETMIYGLDQLSDAAAHAHLAKDAYFAIHRGGNIGIYVSGVDGSLRFPSKHIGAVLMALRDAELASAKLEHRQPSSFAAALEKLQ